MGDFKCLGSTCQNKGKCGNEEPLKQLEKSVRGMCDKRENARMRRGWGVAEGV